MQTFENWELIVVDDGSQDDTEELLQGYIQSDSRISYIKRPPNRRKGANTCRNIGIENAKGKYIAFLDSDDEWLNDKLKEDISITESRQPCKGLYSGIIIDNGHKKTLGQTRKVQKNESYVDYIFSDGVLTQTSTFFVETNAALKIKFDESLQRHQDMDFFIRFGNSYGWYFISNYNTIVYWAKGTHRSHHFDSMIRFYERYEAQISSVNKKARYLTWSWVLAKMYQKSYKNYYISELKKLRPSLSIKYYVFTLFPELAYVIWTSSSGLFKRFLKKTYDQPVC